MASLVKRGKVWYVKMYDAAGKQRWHKGYRDKAQTEKMERALEDQKSAIRSGDVDPLEAERRRRERPKPAAVQITEYEESLKAAGRSANHVSYTVADIRKCYAFAGCTQVSALSRKDVDRWVLSLMSDNDSPRTINRRIGSVQAFLRNLHETGTIGEYVLARYPKRPVKGTEKRKRRAMSAGECERLIASTPEPRKLLYRFALGTGFRYSEIASLTPSSVNFEQRTVTVRASDAKNKSRDQTVPLHASLHEGLRALCQGKDRDVPIFAMPRKADAANQLRADCKAAGVDAAGVDFHALRHSFITRLAENRVHPAVLKTLARHSQLETTLNYYVHFRQSDEINAIAEMAI